MISHMSDTTDDIVAQIAMAITEIGPSPNLICDRLGIQKKTLFQFINQYVSLKSAYYEKVQQIIETIEEFGANKLTIAQALGYKRIMVTRYINENPEIKEIFIDSDEAIIDLAEQKLVEQLTDGNWYAVELVIGTKGRSRGWSKSDKSVLQKEADRLGLNLHEIAGALSDVIAGHLVDNEAGDNEDD